jgi:hypothetical protein
MISLIGYPDDVWGSSCVMTNRDWAKPKSPRRAQPSPPRRDLDARSAGCRPKVELPTSPNVFSRIDGETIAKIQVHEGSRILKDILD